MKIINLWSLHFECFLIEVEGSAPEFESFKQDLAKAYPNKTFFLVRRLE